MPSLPFAAGRRWTALLTLSTLTVGLLSACGNSETAQNSEPLACAPDVAEIEFAVLTTESQENLKSAWTPLFEEMEVALKRPVRGFYATDYAGIVEGMGSGKVHGAWYGVNSYIEAADRAGAEAFAQTVQLNGEEGYYSYLITHKDNPILANIDVEAGNGHEYVVENGAELTFGFNDINSTSGFLVPTYYVFAQQGVRAETLFENVVFAGSHEATALAVSENQIDVATNNSHYLSRLAETNPEALEKIQIIWTSPIIPNDPLAYHEDLPDCLKTAMQDFLVNYDNAEVLEALKWQKFVAAEDSAWDTIRELKIAKEILEVEGDDRLSEERKESQLQELNQKLETLQNK